MGISISINNILQPKISKHKSMGTGSKENESDEKKII